ncbi:MAG: hypothetical protein WB297_06635 [Actinomycetota bacterium]
MGTVRDRRRFYLTSTARGVAHDEWHVVRRYMSAESLAKARLEVIDGEVVEEVRSELVAAS